jgi:hypothetical protein
MNKLKIECTASPETNDHKASIIIDGNDWLGEEYMGLDPPRLFKQESLLAGGNTLIGRCNCGCEGCGDYFVEVEISVDKVQWKSINGPILSFDRTEYENEINFKRNDNSWEDKNRTAERFVDSIFDSIVLADGYKYDWASARIGKGKISLSFSKGAQQKLIDFGWDPENPESAKKRAMQIRAEMT